MVTTPGWINFEGGGRDESECVEPCLGCDGGPTEGPGDPGGGGGGGGGCEPFAFSVADDTAIAQCIIDEACEGDPDCEELCENFYGDFRFGLNSTSEGSTDPQTGWVTAADWLPPRGHVTLNSTCPGIVTRELRFDLIDNQLPQDIQVVGADLTPATLDAAIAAYHVANPTALSACFLKCSSECVNDGSHYETEVKGTYVGGVNSGISGICLLTDNGNNPTVTGYGLLIDRTDNTLKFVQWINQDFDSVILIDSTPYTPDEGDDFTLRAKLECPCPSVVANARPNLGNISVVAFKFDGSLPFWTPDTGPESIALAEYETLLYGGVGAATVDNDEELNAITWRKLSVRHFHVRQACL